MSAISISHTAKEAYIIRKNTRKLHDVTKKNEINRIRDRGEIRRKKVAAHRERVICVPV